MDEQDQIDAVLEFWFEELEPRQWFEKDAAVDAAIRERFGALHERLCARVPPAWTCDAHGYLAAIIVLDQFSRNLHRDDVRAFAADPVARVLAGASIEQGHDGALGAPERAFFYLPFEHSEQLADQDRSVALFEAAGDAVTLDYARRHRDVIRRFGRFPHRNAALGRDSTPEERAYLEEPDAGF